MKQVFRKHYLPLSIEEAWEFFSNPRNLQDITPAEMKFIITSEPPEKMYPGLIITYIVTPLLNIPLKWVTEITHVREGEYFVDNQKMGPFRVWHHQHIFRKSGNGTEMTDIVTYAAPFGLLGRIAEKLIVNKRVRHIFDFRQKVLEERFGKP